MIKYIVISMSGAALPINDVLYYVLVLYGMYC